MTHQDVCRALSAKLVVKHAEHSALSLLNLITFRPVNTNMSGAASIVNTLKSKIKETADELEKYEGISEENRAKYNAEMKAREEIEAEVLSLNRKIKLLEDNLKRHEDR